MNIPFWLPVGHVLKYDARKMRFEDAIGSGILRFRYIDGDEEIVLVPIGKDGTLSMPTVEWMITQFRSGMVSDDDFNAHITDRNEENLKLDRAACIDIDKKSGWRFDWADAARRDKIVRTDQHAKAWIAENDYGGKKPAPSSMLRWMRILDIHNGRIGALVSTAGRLKGQSQLSDIEDRLVHKHALRYWRSNGLNGHLNNKDDAAALMISEWDVLKEMGIHDLGDQPPSAETVRKRINDLECYSTHASRFGCSSADKRFTLSGEPVPVARPFERMFMDGVEWEHSVFYSDELKIPAAKMKSVITMDAFSQWVPPHPTFAGQYRSQWGLAALRGILLPPNMTEEEIAADPELAMFYGLPSDIMYDRDRTMIAPRLVPGALKVFSTIELAEAYHSDAKAKLENYNKFVKASLRKVRGRILGARDQHDVRYNPLKDTGVTRAQYVDLIESCRRQWNSTPKSSLGHRSPNDLMRDFIQSGQMRLAHPEEVRRTFASTPPKKCQLNTNGLIYDNILYRHCRDDGSKALSANFHKTSFADRIKSGAKVDVTIRVWDDDIDMIEVFDDVNKKYFPMWSTDPGYTGGLNRWEHHIYQKALKSVDGRTYRDRLRNKGKHLNDRQETLSGKSFREREESVELLAAEEIRLSGKRGQNPDCAKVPELHIPTTVDGAQREDIPSPPPQRAVGDDLHGADDLRSNPSKALKRELGEEDELDTPINPSWSFDDSAVDDEDDI